MAVIIGFGPVTEAFHYRRDSPPRSAQVRARHGTGIFARGVAAAGDCLPRAQPL